MWVYGVKSIWSLVIFLPSFPFICPGIKTSLSCLLYLTFKSASASCMENVSGSLESLENVSPGGLDGWSLTCDHVGFQFLRDYCSLCLPAAEISLSSSLYTPLLWWTPQPSMTPCLGDTPAIILLSPFIMLCGVDEWNFTLFQIWITPQILKSTCLKEIKFLSLWFENCSFLFLELKNFF